MRKESKSSCNLPLKEVDRMRTENIFCPCINCLNGRRQILDDIPEHLLCDGIKKNYTMWIWHGELTNMQTGSQSEPFDVEMGDHFENMVCDFFSKHMPL